jgi:alpha,alpha-trehalase
MRHARRQAEPFSDKGDVVTNKLRSPDSSVDTQTDPAHALRARDFEAAVFDLDGVVTRTARVHAAAWKELFDAYLEQVSAGSGEPFRPFDADEDYRLYVDGKPRYEGVRSFLESRGIRLPYGDPEDPPERETVCGLGNRKNALFHERLEKDGVEVFESSVKLIRTLRERGLKTALVSSSKNARAVLEVGGLTDLFDAIVDGVEAARLGLKGKPDPDIFLRAAEVLGVVPQHALAVEDALAGVEAARAGGFGLVIGVDRTGEGAALRAHGAHFVVRDLGEVHVRPQIPAERCTTLELPNAADRWEEIARLMRGKRPAVFLDYDGTLTPIVERPDLAVLTDEMRATVKELATLCTVAVVSGRDRADVQALVGLDELVYAGSHGFDIAGPEGLRVQHEKGADYLPALARAHERLGEALRGVEGVLVERKRFAIAVHFRQVAELDVDRVEAAVDEVVGRFPKLRKTYGKKIFELRPRIDWDKGKAVLWLLEALRLQGESVLPLYVGDDTTDEDAFAALAERSIGILVARAVCFTAARYVLRDPNDVARFLRGLIAMLKGGAP